MTLPIDPTPFILAAGHTKITPPPAGLLSVEAVGLVTDGGIPLHRLYTPGRQGFFQLHLDSAGNPDECRWFSQLDEINPASADEWGFWLDPVQGMIGWPEFQTKDGRTYARAWAPGSGRIPPRQQDETIEDLRGRTARKHQAMLYAAATGAPAPAPQVEYILVSAVEQQGQAWIEVLVGIDINPAALAPTSVPLS